MNQFISYNLKRKVWVILLFLFAILSGCRTENQGTTTSQPITITFASHQFDQSSYEPLIQKFQEQNPGIVVQYISLEDAFGEATTSATMRQLASLADVVLFDGSPLAEASNSFLNLDSFLSADNSFAHDEFWPGLLASCQVGGIQIGIPTAVSANLIFFKGAAFTTSELPYPQPGWTWADFEQVAQQLAQGTDIERQYGFVMNGNPIFLLGSHVQQLVDDQSNLTGDQLDANLGWFIDLVDADIIFSPSSTPDQAVNRDILITQEKAAMWLGGHFELNRMRQEFGNDIGVLPYPVAANNNLDRTTPLRPACAMISAGSQNPEAAWAWIHFLTTQIPPNLRGDMPVRSSVAEDTNYWNNWDEETVATFKFALTHGWYGDFSSPSLATVAEAFEQVLANGLSFSAILPATIEVVSTSEPPILDDSPVVVATPRATSTPIIVDVPAGETIIVDYYADLTLHHSQDAVEALATAFNEAQNRIQVRLFTDRPEFQGTYGIEDMAGAYDCFVWGGSATAFSQTIDHFYSLEALWAAEDTSLRDDLSPALLESNRVAGELYALPIASQPYIIYYDVALFAELSLERPSPNWTIDEFWALAIASAEGGNNQRFGFVPNIWSTIDLLLLSPQSPSLYNMDTVPPTVRFDDPEIVQALAWLSDMVDTGVMFPKDQTTPAQIQQQGSIINNRQAAMWIGLAGENQTNFEIGTAPIPIISSPLPIASSMSAYISRRANNPTGCWEWLKFLSSHPDAFQGIPARKSILESPEWISVVGEENAATYRDSLSRPVRMEPTLTDPNLFVPFPFFVWWEDSLQLAFSGGNPAEILGDMQVKVDMYLPCILAIEVRDFDAVSNCAKQADPDFSPEF